MREVLRRCNSNKISPVHPGGGFCHLDYLDCHRLHDNHHLDAQVAHGGNNIISLGKGSCPQPPPRAQQFCNVIDCPVQWQASSWTKVIVANTNKHTGTLMRASLPPIDRHQNKQDLVVMPTLRRSVADAFCRFFLLSSRPLFQLNQL